MTENTKSSIYEYKNAMLGKNIDQDMPTEVVNSYLSQ